MCLTARTRPSTPIWPSNWHQATASRSCLTPRPRPKSRTTRFCHAQPCQCCNRCQAQCHPVQATSLGASTTTHSCSAPTIQSWPVKTAHSNTTEEIPTCHKSTNSQASAKSLEQTRFRSTTRTMAMLEKCRSAHCCNTSKPHSQRQPWPPTCSLQAPSPHSSA